MLDHLLRLNDLLVNCARTFVWCLSLSSISSNSTLNPRKILQLLCKQLQVRANMFCSRFEFQIAETLPDWYLIESY